MDDVFEVFDRLEQCGRLMIEGNLHERFFELAHGVESDVLEPVGEHLHMRRTHPTGHGGVGHPGQIPQSGRVLHKNRGLAGVHPQLGPEPRIQSRGAVELVILGGVQLDQQLSLQTIESVLRSLNSVQLLAYVTTLQSTRGGAHRVKCGPRVHTPHHIRTHVRLQGESAGFAKKIGCHSRVLGCPSSDRVWA